MPQALLDWIGALTVSAASIPAKRRRSSTRNRYRAVTQRFPLPSDVDYPNPADNAVAIAALCLEVAKLKGVRLPDKYGDE